MFSFFHSFPFISAFLNKAKQRKTRHFSVSSVNFQHLRLGASEVFRLASWSYDQKFMCVQPQKFYIMMTAVKYSNFRYFSGNTKVAERLAGRTGLLVNLS